MSAPQKPPPGNERSLTNRLLLPGAGAAVVCSLLTYLLPYPWSAPAGIAGVVALTGVFTCVCVIVVRLNPKAGAFSYFVKYMAMGWGGWASAAGKFVLLLLAFVGFFFGVVFVLLKAFAVR